MALAVTRDAQSDQILFRVGSTAAAKPNMMNLEILHASACLASPIVSLEHLPVQSRVALGVQLQTRTLRQNLLHAALPFMADRKASFCASGRKW